MLQALREILTPYYMQVKFVHLLAVMVWLWSTAVAYAFYLVPVFKLWRRNPYDAEILPLRDWVIERFDHGAIYEHIAFPIVLLTGTTLLLVGGWTMGADWLALKLLIVIGLFVPVEICDYYLAHLGGNKAHLRKVGDPVRYERAIHRHWWFLLVSTPPVMIFGIVVVYLAVTKSL